MGKLTRKEYEHMLDHTPDLTLPGSILIHVANTAGFQGCGRANMRVTCAH